MKKFFGLLALLAILGFTACSDSKPAEVKKEIIIVPTVPAPVPEKGTIIVLDKNGVKVATKKVDVTVKPPKQKQ